MYNYVANGLSGNIGQELQNYLNISDEIGSNSVFLHIAAKSQGNYKELISSNINYLIETIDFCKKNNIQNFIFFSALSILNKDDLYSHTKKIGELILKETDLNILILRLPMVLTKDRNNGILNRIVTKLKSDEDIILFNAHKKFNNFIAVEDIVNVIKNYTFSKKYEIIHLVSNDDMSLLKIVEFLKVELNSKSQIIISDEKQELLSLKPEYKTMNTQKKLKRWLNGIK